MKEVEVIKKKELLKYYTLNQENDYLNKYIENFYKKLKISTEEEFMTYLSEYNLKIEDVKKKLEIEVVWNEFIFTKYKDQINRSLTTDLGNLINKAKHDPSLTYKND